MDDLNLKVGNGFCQHDEELDSNASDAIYTPQVNHELKPYKGQEFETLNGVHEFYNKYAKEAGFSVRIHSSRKSRHTDEILRKEYVCYKEGTCSKEGVTQKERRRKIIKEGCKAKIAVVKSKSGTFVVTVFVEGHNHPLESPRKVHLLRSHRSISSVQKSLTQQLNTVNIPKPQQLSILETQAGGIENIGCTQKDIYNYESDQLKDMKEHDEDMLNEHFLLEQEKNPSFYFKIKADNEKRITHCFWADATSRRAYKFYDDVLIFDTTHNTNRYGMIFASLMGVNNHGQRIIFACSFLCDETTESFVWLFKQFKKAMQGDSLKMIITDQDPAMIKAISQALPKTFHMYCSWHILNKFFEKLDAVKYKDYYRDFQKCIWESETREEFDSTWVEVVQKSGLNDNKWLQSIHEIRSAWVPAYVNYIFSAGLSSSQQVESSHSFFKRYISKNNSFVDFMIQFNRALVHQRFEELIADHVDVNEKPVLKLPMEMEMQMSEIYTQKYFYKFQDELWESFNFRFELLRENEHHCLYKVQKTNDEKYKVREIIYEKNLDFASCSCKKFESGGIPCRHILAYLNKMHDVAHLSNQYIMKRWTKTAKSERVITEDGTEITDDRSLFVRRSRLFLHASNVIDKVLLSEEASKIFTDALDSVLEKTRLLVGSGSDVVVVDKASNTQYSYNEPSQVRAKRCGKRLKGGNEIAISKAKDKPRCCHGCGIVGQSHDKRNCPMLSNRSSPCNNDGNLSFSNRDDDSFSSIGRSQES